MAFGADAAGADRRRCRSGDGDPGRSPCWRVSVSYTHLDVYKSQVQGSDVTVEYDKLIDRQLERAAITSISGFAKLFSEAAKVLRV